HDTATTNGVKILSFNAWHLRMIASSRRKTDRRDAYWVAKALQTGMTPTPVHADGRGTRASRAVDASTRSAAERTHALAVAGAVVLGSGWVHACAGTAFGGDGDQIGGAASGWDGRDAGAVAAALRADACFDVARAHAARRDAASAGQ